MTTENDQTTLTYDSADEVFESFGYQMRSSTNKLSKANKRLKHEISERNRAEQINRVLFRISNAVNTTKDLNELYGSIHRILGEVIDLTNFFICIYHKQSNRVSFPYFVDQYDSGYVYAERINIENSLTGEVLLAQKTLLHKRADLLLREAENRLVGTAPEIWIGVPLKIEGEVIGIMSTQCYEDENRFDSIDLDILNSVSEQVALAIERKRNEQALVASEKKYRTIIESIEDGYYEIDLEGNFTLVNRALAKMLGYSRHDLPGMNTADYMSENSVRQISASFASVLATNQPGKTLELELIKRDGETCYAETVVTIVCNDGGEPIGFRGISRDITERKLAEEEKTHLETLNRHLQKTESLSRMAGAIAHHFNNQLGAVIGNLEMAILDLPEDSDKEKFLANAMKASRKAAEISGLMLTYLGQTAGKFVPLDLSEVCRQNLVLLQAAVPKNITFAVDLSSPGPVIRADTNQIQQVLANLVSNAWEAVEKNRGSIGLAVKVVPAADLAATRCFPIDWQPQKSHYACLEVKDGGLGIAEKDIDKLFDPFYSSKVTGRGLGLAIVQGIAKAHNGAVTVHSQKGNGSIFRVFFPLLKEKVAYQPDKAVRPCLLPGGETVLLVDDDEMMRNMAEALLTRLGFKVLSAVDGCEAVEVYEQFMNEISLVLCDLTMPRMDGWQTLSALRQRNPNLPAVLVSGHDESKASAGKRSDLLYQVFLHKPYLKAELVDALAKAMAAFRH